MRTGLWPQVSFFAFVLDCMLAPQTKQIEIVVNGRTRSTPEGLNLSGLLVLLRVDPARVALELNRSIVARKDWDQTNVEKGATLEIVQFVGGG
jgi:thiamine biosynthesis protein ThiS